MCLDLHHYPGLMAFSGRLRSLLFSVYIETSALMLICTSPSYRYICLL